MKNAKLFQSVIAVVMLSFMVSPSVTTVLGEAITETRKLLYGSMYNSCEKQTKDTDNDFVIFDCIDVYPLSGWDTYSKMKVNVANSTSTRSISDVFTIDENDNERILSLNEDWDTGDVIRLRVRGNNPDKDAYADFVYNPN